MASIRNLSSHPIPGQARLSIAMLLALLSLASQSWAQSVCLPAPRLLTTMPMGGQIGTEVEITITGEELDDAADLIFSDPRLTAIPKLNAEGQPEPNRYVVTIPADCPAGLYEARLMTRLGISSSRVFSVGSLTEVTRSQPNTSLATALRLPMNSVCNAVVSARAADHYVFSAKKDQRITVDCAASGIDSKLKPTVIIADAQGRDLLVERRGGVLDFTAPEAGDYVIKIHELTYKGGPEFFYRLGLWEQTPGSPIVRQPSTRAVNSFSWPPTGLPESTELVEVEPNHESSKAQKITLPCDITGSFYPAADVDVFEFEAQQGEEWWIEIASERLGVPTDPTALVQHVAREGDAEKVTDVLELADIPSPIKVSSNGYAYDGPPYNSGTSDFLGKLTIKQSGVHRLQLSDLFGGTRNDPGNHYRLVIRQAAPDFALVSWAMHMELRNGDRNALSKPISLRGGATMALEVVVVRRDGFDGDIDLFMHDLPSGVSARGLKIPAGQSRGLMLVTADENAPKGYANAKFFAKATIAGIEVTRTCQLASMAWPIRDSWGEIPSPRLISDVPVSVSGVDRAPITIAPASRDVIEAKAGEKLTIPLVHTRRSDFSGAKMSLKTAGAGFERAAAFDVSLTEDQSQAVLDLAAIKPAPGDYLIAFYGSAVAKYCHHPEAVGVAEVAVKKAEQDVAAAAEELKKLTAEAQSASAEQKAASDKAVADATARQQSATAALNAAKEQLKKATAAAQPRDIVDIVVSEPIAIRILPAESP